ncbi:hypothetical protein [Kiloniella sp.]|uniref:hypothetical protein n=1 Tax=Kiloniella sp. TaxID=1938587 RepID=UPI003B02E3F1
MLIVIYLLYVKLSETIHINRLLGGRHLFLLNKAEKSQQLGKINIKYNHLSIGFKVNLAFILLILPEYKC